MIKINRHWNAQKIPHLGSKLSYLLANPETGEKIERKIESINAKGITRKF